MSNKKIKIDDKIFIAGVTGMAGQAIKRNLIKSGYKNLLTPIRKELNFFNLEDVKKWFLKNKPDIVIIAAAKVGGILANSSQPTQFLLDNLKIQNNLIETSWKSDVKRLLFLGSSCIYPKFASQPIKEEELLKGSLEKTNQWYAVAKIAGIKLCEALREQYNFDAISLMPTNLYGPGDNYHPDNSHVMASLIRKFYTASKKTLPEVNCWGTGSVYREFLHSDDLGSAVVFALEKWDPSSINAPLDVEGKPLNILNVGTGIDITIKELVNLIASEVNFKGIVNWDSSKPDGTPKKLLNVERLSKLGWEPKISLEKGIKDTISLLQKEQLFEN